MHASTVPTRPPIAPMLARLVRELPQGDYIYEPKWDGFRAICSREHARIDIGSRHGRPFARYFPELTRALGELRAERFVIDGEIVIVRDGRFDFEALMLRTHPAASRVEQLSAETPATFIAFDALAVGGEDLSEQPFVERRSRLEELLAGSHGSIKLTPATSSRDEAAEWLRRFTGNGVDGVVAKHRSQTYEPGKRAMLKVKVERTADCVVAGFRAFPSGLVASLLLGLHDETGVLRHVGVCSTFGADRRRELFELMRRAATTLDGHPWEAGFGLERSPVGRLKGSAGRWHPGMTMDWTPIEPMVAEVRYDTLDDLRFRHPALFLRWRPDREPQSCGFDQLVEVDTDAEALLSGDTERNGACS